MADNLPGRQVVGTMNARELIRMKTYRTGGKVLIDSQSVLITRFQLD